MGFGNLGTTIAYLNSLESGISNNKKDKAKDNNSDSIAIK
jgi:hypothetical protein